MKSNICIWNDLLLSDVKDLSNCSTKDEIKRKLCDKLNYDCNNLTSKEKVLLDLHFHTLLFAKERKYNEEQTSALFSIIKRTHEKAVESPFGNIDDTLSYFKELLASHSVKRPPFCIHIFAVQEVVAITEYVVNTYFKHFKLYKYAFTPKIVLNISVKYSDMVEEEVQADEGCDDGSAEVENEAGNEETALEPLSSEDEDPPAIKELKQIIGSALDEEITKLKLTVDEKLKTNEENLLKQIEHVKDGGNTQSEKRSTTKVGKRKGGK